VFKCMTYFKRHIFSWTKTILFSYSKLIVTLNYLVLSNFVECGPPDGPVDSASDSYATGSNPGWGMDVLLCFPVRGRDGSPTGRPFTSWPSMLVTPRARHRIKKNLNVSDLRLECMFFQGLRMRIYENIELHTFDFRSLF